MGIQNKMQTDVLEGQVTGVIDPKSEYLSIMGEIRDSQKAFKFLTQMNVGSRFASTVLASDPTQAVERLSFLLNTETMKQNLLIKGSTGSRSRLNRFLNTREVDW